MQLLLYAPATSPRLNYICHFIFKELMAVDFLIISDKEEFKNYEGIKIRYSNEHIAQGHLTIGNCGLLFETEIREQDTCCFDVNGCRAFFKTEYGDLPFDIFGASFFLLSRYEEYLPHKKDMYGRYAHGNSMAFRENFLHLPLINIWVNQLKEIILEKFPGFILSTSSFTFLPTYDIDMAYSYRHKGWLRNLGGMIISPSFNRVKLLLGPGIDPFDSYAFLDEIHSRNNLHPVYFFLLAEQNGKYDKNILPGKKAMRQLIQVHAKKYRTGIHPSWQSGDHPALLINEKEQLESIGGNKVLKSRQHYIRFNLPHGYRRLMEIGITDDYSMGYGSINGFRASVASSFYWYDLQSEASTILRIHPFCFMDANSYYEQKLSATEAYNELMRYYYICKAINGQLITIWHNNFLGTDPQFAGWRDTYLKFIAEISNLETG